MRRWVYFVGAGRPSMKGRLYGFSHVQRKTSEYAVYNHRSDYEYRVRIEYTVFKMFFHYERTSGWYRPNEVMTWAFLAEIAEVKVYIIHPNGHKELVGMARDGYAKMDIVA